MIKHKQMRKTLYAALALIILATACKKEEKGDDPSSAQLIPASTGWQRVSTIPYQKIVSGLPGNYAMTPYDLTSVGNELALLYSDDYKLFAVDGHIIMKLMLNDGPVDAAAKAVRLNYGRYNNAHPVYRFVPGSFTTISSQFLNNGCYIFDETMGMIASQELGSINALPTVRWYPDGNILASMKDGPYSSASWIYKYPAIGNFKYVVNEWTGDSTRNVASSSMKLNDDKVYDLVFSSRNNTMYFSVISNLHAPQTGSANYEIICRNTVPDLDGSKQYSVVSSDVQGDAQTIVLGEWVYDGNPRIVKLTAFRWQKGATTLEKLYSIADVSEEMSQSIVTLTTNSSFPNEVRFMPNGSIYFLREYVTSQGTGAYTALVIIGKDGIKESGKIEHVAMEKIKRVQFQLHCCRYLNGAFYAIVHPAEEYDYDVNAPEFRIEVVKLTL